MLERTHFRTEHPGLHILVSSERTFHPALVEAISNHIFARLHKPLDPEELIYLLRGI